MFGNCIVSFCSRIWLAGYINNYVGGVTYGDIYVTVFFFISGALLFYNHSEVDDLKLFYKKEHYLSSRHSILHGD